MAVGLGAASPLSLPVVLNQPQLRAVADVMSDLLAKRTDTAQNLAAYVAAAAAVGGSTFGLTEMADSVPSKLQQGRVRRVFANAIGSARWQEDALVDALIGAAPRGEAQVAVIEYTEVPMSAPIWGVVSLHALGPGWTIPLDWRRVALGDENCESRLTESVEELLEILSSRYRFAGNLDPGCPPLVALDRQLGEWPDLRAAVAARVPEYGMVISAGYARDRVITDIFAERQPGAGLGAYFGSWPVEEAPPRPLPLRRSRGRRGEFAVPFSSGSRRLVAVVRPCVSLGGDALQGRQLEARAIELGGMLGRVRHASMTMALRLDAFQHANSRLFRRHALLLSVLHAVVCGQLTTGTTGKDL